MSLIQEALRRRQEEDQDGVTPSAPPLQAPTPSPKPVTTPESAEPATQTAAPAPPPPPLPSPVTPTESLTEGEQGQKPKKASRTWVTLFGVTLILLLLLAGAAWMLSFVYRRWSARQAQATVEAPADTPAIVVSTGDTDPQPPEVTTPVDASPDAPSRPAPVQPVDRPTPSTDVARRPVAQPPPETAPAVDWPLLRLTGVVGKGKNGSAVINGEIVSVGEAIEGAVLLSIDRLGASLEYRGDRRLMKVGTTIQ